MANIFPTMDEINKLKVQPTEGERKLLNYLIQNLHKDIEIFYQPFLDGDRPDIVLIQRGIGATIIEVKDWDLKKYNISIQDEWSIKSKNQKIKSPFAWLIIPMKSNTLMEIRIGMD